MFGSTKTGEYYRTIEMLERIAKEQGIYFVLAFLHDSQYTDTDIKAMMNLMENQHKLGIKPITRL